MKFLFYCLVSIILTFDVYAEGDKKLITLPENIYFENIYSGERVLKKIYVTNISANVVLIKEVKTSCGCTTTDISSKVIEPGEKVKLQVALSTSGKSGKISKSVRIYLEGQRGYYRTNISGEIKVMPKKHMAMKGNIFEGKCVECHVKPAENKLGHELYLGVCASCHGVFMEGHSAPQLKIKKYKEKELYSFIADGKKESMPAFSEKSKGPLNDKQIKSLVDFIISFEDIKNKKSAEGLYRQFCSACHGEKREGGVGPELSIKSMQTLGREKIDRALVKGIPNTLMKPFLANKGGQLNSKEIRLLIEFLLGNPTIRKK